MYFLYYLREIKLQTMKTKLLLFLFFTTAVFQLSAQDRIKLIKYYSAGIDSLVAESKRICDDFEEEKTNPVYAPLFTSPVLYSKVIGKIFSIDEKKDNEEGCNLLSLDAKRGTIIENMMMNLYRNAPQRVAMTEEELRSAKPISNETKITAPLISIDNIAMPDNVAGDMKTNVVKPKYWTFKGKVAFRFSQNYISGNWYQGGESNKTMLGELDLDMNYDDKNRITIKNHLDVDLGFTTSKADTLHSFKTNTDRLKLESTLGYRLVKDIDLTARMKLETQMLPNYPVNSPDFVSKFMAPFDANFSIGITYKPKWKNFALDLYVAPLSAYNYKFVRYGELASRYGIKEGRHHKEDFGTQFVLTVPSVKLFKIVDFWSKAEYYTNYTRAFFHLESKFDIALTRYFSASLSIHARFDDSAPGLYDNDYGYWQFKELMMLGLVYSW